eukprot:TRINITY_DN1444_c0_g1_i1.p1 TRINITY_DN1444_c0_g1~~TRINITY_DN1444_c0_g1_i1.p1  ORF type:complete len:102 (+),score=14.70 TRINITY_DN1444_c0_g1_i1:39-344(+)
MKEGDILYLDNAKVQWDPKFRTIKAIFAKKQIEVCYLPSNSTSTLSPLDQSPFAVLRNAWNTLGYHKNETPQKCLRRASCETVGTRKTDHNHHANQKTVSL